jgi:hypothetical protein
MLSDPDVVDDIGNTIENSSDMKDLFWHHSKKKSSELRFETTAKDHESIHEFISISLKDNAKLRAFLDASILHASDRLKQDDSRLNFEVLADETAPEVMICDNTVGIARLYITVSTSKFEDNEFEGKQVDTLTNVIAEHFINLVTTEILHKQLLTVYSLHPNGPIGNPFDYQAFFDFSTKLVKLADGSLAWESQTYNPVLWVCRICRLDDLQKKMVDRVSAWAQLMPENVTNTFKSGKTHYFSWGNNVVYCRDPKQMSDIISTCTLAQYQNSVLDILNDNLRSLYALLSDRVTKRSKREVGSIRKRAARISYFIGIFLIEMSESQLKLQGSRQYIYSELSQIYHLSLLSDSVNKKCALVTAKLEQIQSKKSLKYQRGIETVLTCIGLIALVEFALNLSWFSKDIGNDQDTVPGLTDIAHSTSPDTLLYVAIGLALIITYAFYRGQNGKH